MKITKGAVTGAVIVVLVVVAALAAFQSQKNRQRKEFAQRIYAQNSEVSPDTMEGLKASIAQYEKRIEQHIQDAAKTASYWKILAIRLSDKGFYGEALDALERAIYYSPTDPALHYHTGVAAGIMAKSQHLFPGKENTERTRYFALAEESFLRAIELDSRYLRPRYSLGVLYVFEFDRPQDAIPHLERYLEISRGDVDAMFVLARAFYMLKNYRAALDLYDRIITLTRDDQKRLDAQNNRQMVMEQTHG